jgi:hypothetical protein
MCCNVSCNAIQFALDMPILAPAHDYSHVGKNERQRISLTTRRLHCYFVYGSVVYSLLNKYTVRLR